MEKVMNCRTCKNAIYDPVWGEYKCSVLKRTVYKFVQKAATEETGTSFYVCDSYSEGEPSISKENEEYNELYEED